MKRLDILPRHQLTVLSLPAQFAPGVEVRAFGSRTSGKARPYSDLNLVFMTPLDLSDIAHGAEGFSG